MRRTLPLSLLALALPILGCPGGGGEEGLKVVALEPPSGAGGFPVTSSFSVTFNADLDPASAVPGAMKVRAGPGPPVDGTLAVEGPTATLTPSEPLPYDTYYGELDVSGLRDVNGRSLTGPLPWGARTTIGDFDFSAPLPQFVDAHAIAPADVSQISMFRSGVGHDYSDDFEPCRSMKHYFLLAPADWSLVQVSSPVAGRVVERYDEWAGTKLVIRSSAQRAFFFEIFHVVLAGNLQPGDPVAEGQLLGHHYGSATYSDVAVGVATAVDGPKGWIPGRRLVSLFDVLTPARFADWAARGMATRGSARLSAAERDDAPLTCSGEAFTGSDLLPQWLALP